MLPCHAAGRITRKPILTVAIAVTLTSSGPTAGQAQPTESTSAAADDLVLTNVSVVDVLTGRTRAGHTVIVRGDRIRAVRPSHDVNVGTRSRIIDGRGKFLLPGLVDMHVHARSTSFFTMFVAAGVTTVRNMFGSEEFLARRAEIASGRLFGPTLITAGPIIDGDPPYWPGSTVVTTPADARLVVAQQKAAGYDFLKVYGGIRADVYDALAQAAQQARIRFVGHVPRAITLMHALRSGQGSIEHMGGYLEALMKDGVPFKFGRNGLGFAIPNLDTAKIPTVAAATAAAGVWNCPTRILTDRMLWMADPQALERDIRWLEYVPYAIRFSWSSQRTARQRNMTPEDLQLWRQKVALDNQMLAALWRAGAKLLVGSDTANPYVVPGASLHDEIELLVAAGIPRSAVLRAATAGAAEALGRAPGEVGVVAAGARADLVLADSDPLRGPIVIPPAGVVIRGIYYDRAKLRRRLDSLKPPPSPPARRRPL
jgi:hypothetical protein